MKRKTLLKIMLAALGTAAGAALLAVLVQDRGVVWRVTASGVIAAAAAAVMMLMTLLVDRPKTRAGGMLGMFVCIAEFVLATALLWIGAFGYRWEEAIALTAGVLVPCGLVGTGFLCFINAPGWRLAATWGCAAALGSFVGLTVASFVDGLNWFGGSDRLWITGWCVGWTGVITALCLVGLGRPDPAPWRWLGVVGAVAGAGMTIYGVWFSRGGNEAWPVGATMLGAVVAHAIVCNRVRLIGWQRWVRFVAIAGAIATAIVVVYSVGVRGRDPLYLVERSLTAAGIVTGSATMALFVLALLNRRVDVVLTPLASITRVMLICPRCEKKLELAVGGAMCSGCRLHIKVEVQASRCAACGYDLSNLSAERCPECGTVIPAAPAV